MIEKCANPLCGEPFKYFRGGRIYVIDHSDLIGHKCSPDAGGKAEHFWLCPACCRQNTSAISISNGTVKVVLCAKAPRSRQNASEDERECKAA